jgi:acyl transferase domain-containing protein/thioesterase domain-containing protein/acyl carrier protein
MSDTDDEDLGSRIAVIGMAGRFPGAPDVARYWRNLCAGVESVKFFTDEELLAAGESPELLADPAYVRAWPVLEDIEQFDAGFFGMSPRDAAIMDPQHRFFLEVAWSALEHAGYAPETRQASTGVFAACGMNTYMMYHLVTNPEVMRTVGEWLVRHTGNDMNFLATRLSYQMNLKGPAMNVQTACSSSLVAVHLACQSLLGLECDVALAGASTFSLPQNKGYLFKEGEILSRDGHCRPFDAGSRGTLFGSGTGVVVLKRLADAIADRDNILGVIAGSAINNDGSEKVGYLAPSVEGQARAIAEALAVSGVPPESVSYVETHGTGTAIGDPIEVAALMQGYGGGPEAKRTCAIGSVKGNIGHLGEAAGMAGLIKTLLALQHKKLPPSINYERPNPEIAFDAGRFYVNAELRDWSAPAGARRRAGVTALGAGGTNAHLVLEEAPPVASAQPAPRRHQLLTLSAKTPAALERAAEALARHLEQDPGVDLADVAFTLQAGRRHFPHRRAVAAADAAGAIEALRAPEPKGKDRAADAPARGARSVVFMFPGGGAQYASMGRDLYEREPVYSAALDECLATMDATRSRALRALMFAPEAERAKASAELERPSLALPALFATEYAVGKQMQAWGVAPAAFIGHSMGEYVAACLAGVFSVRDGMALVATRGRLFETLPSGGMLSVPLPEAELGPLLGAELSIAAVNGPALCVASGPVAAIDALERRLAEREVDTTRIHISVAAHSRMLEPILDEFERFCRTIRFSPPKAPFISNVTGAWITPAEATDPKYWVRHLRQTVRFSQGVTELCAAGDRVLIEIGPGRTLSSLARQQPKPPVAVPSLRHPQEQADDVAFLLQTVGRAWAAGAAVDFARIHGEGRRRVPLPTYSFDRARYWIEAGQPAAASPKAKTSLQKTPELDRWFFTPAWKPSVAPPPEPAPAGAPWLIFADEAGVAQRLGARAAVRVTRGVAYQRLAADHYVVRPDAREDYEALFEDLQQQGVWPEQLVYLWPLDVQAGAGRTALALFAKGRRRTVEAYDQAERLCFSALLALAQALGPVEKPVTLTIVSTGLHGFESPRGAEPEKALLVGPLRVIPREFPHVRTRSIDLLLGGAAAETDVAVRRLVDELGVPARDAVVALRGPRRWTQAFEPAPLGIARREQSPIRQRGVYVITGGLGGIGLEVALHLARTAKARLVLVGRGGLPDRARWAEARAAGGDVARRIEKVLEIEAAGGEVLAVSADVTSRTDMQRAAEAARRRFGRVNGVIHSAGTIDDALISLKRRDAALAVMAVKAKGALVLDEVFAADALELFVVFSSVSSVLGLEGQIDYTSANAFLDAFAEAKARQGRTHAVSIGWNAWQEVGMAVALAGRPTGAPAHAGPWLERVDSDGGGETVLSTAFSRGKQWVLGEHVVRGGEALIPGTGYLELLRAAFARSAPTGAFEIRDLTFLAPFVVAANETRELHVRLSRQGGQAGPGADVTFYSQSPDAPHVTARVDVASRAAPPRADVAALLARCSARVEIVGGHLGQAFMDFGPRWANVDRVCFGEGEAVVCLTLPEAFAAELADFPLHPALLDMATGGAQPLLDGFDRENDFYVPFGYGRFTAFAPLTARLFSHVRRRPSESKDVAIFDVTIYDADGRALVDVAGFTMKRVPRTFTSAASRAEAAGEGARPPGFGESKLGAALKLGMLPAEGVEAFDRVLAARIAGHVVASSVDLGEWLVQVDAQARRAAGGGSAEASGEPGDAAGFARPELGSELVAPRNEIERALAAMWRDVLGLKEIGIRDDFFELGGQSLVAVRLFNKIRKKYGVDLPLSTLFEAPTIERCAQIVAAEAGLALDAEEARPPSDAASDAACTGHPESAAVDVGRMLARPAWREDKTPLPAEPGRHTWLAFADAAGVVSALADRLRAKGHRVITVREGDAYHRIGDDAYQLFPEEGAAGYERLVRELWGAANAPTRVLHGWLVTDREIFRPGSSFLHRNLERGFTSLLLFAQALAKEAPGKPLHVVTLSTGMQGVGGETATLHPEKAAALGPVLVIPKELPGVTTSAIDVALPAQGGGLLGRSSDASVPAEVLDGLESELGAAPRDEIVALRGRARHVLGVQSVALAPGKHPGFKDRGVYLVTDGLAGVGLTIAQQLARHRRARLVLLDPGAPPAGGAKLVRELEAAGAEVLVVPADVTNLERLHAVVREAEARFGRVDGVIHAAGSSQRRALVDDPEGEAVFEPRLYGTLALAEVFRGRPLDFLLLCSPASVLNAAAGQVDEVAAAAFLGAFAESARDRRVIAVGWGPWNKPDIGPETLGPDVTPDDGWAALARIVEGSPHASLVVSAALRPALGRPVRTGAPEGSGPREAPRVARTAAAAEHDAAGARLIHLVKMHAGPAGASATPLFLVAGLFGNVLNLRRLAQLVGADRPVYGLQARGLFGGLPPHESFEGMARDYLAEIRTVQPHGPYLLGGFSGGGITAFEMARQLGEAGEGIPLVILLDTPVPRRETLSLGDRLAIQLQNVQRDGTAHLANWVRSKVAYKRRLQTREDRLRAQQAGETRDFHSQVIEAAFYRALERYLMRSAPLRAALFRPQLAPVYRLSGGRLLNGDRDHLYPDNGWTPFVEKLEIREVPGDHDSMVLEPNVRVLALHVREAIARAFVSPDGLARGREDGAG